MLLHFCDQKHSFGKEPGQNGKRREHMNHTKHLTRADVLGYNFVQVFAHPLIKETVDKI